MIRKPRPLAAVRDRRLIAVASVAVILVLAIAPAPLPLASQPAEKLATQTGADHTVE